VKAVNLSEVVFGHLILFKSYCVSRVRIRVVYYVWESHDFLGEFRLADEQFCAIKRSFVFVNLAILGDQLHTGSQKHDLLHYLPDTSSICTPFNVFKLLAECLPKSTCPPALFFEKILNTCLK